MNDVAFLDATAQAELVRNKQIKPIELLEGAIERVQRLNPKINAVVTPMFDNARAAIEAGLPEGPFTGVPFLLKDLGPMYQGVRYTSGSKYLQFLVAPMDSELTVRQRQAGLVTLGKTNTPEFGLVPTTEPSSSAPPATPGAPTARPAARAAVPPPRLPPAWCRWRTPTTAAAVSASRLLAAASSA